MPVTRLAGGKVVAAGGKKNIPPATAVYISILPSLLLRVVSISVGRLSIYMERILPGNTL